MEAGQKPCLELAIGYDNSYRNMPGFSHRPTKQPGAKLLMRRPSASGVAIIISIENDQDAIRTLGGGPADEKFDSVFSVRIIRGAQRALLATRSLSRRAKIGVSAM